MGTGWRRALAAVGASAAVAFALGVAATGQTAPERVYVYTPKLAPPPFARVLDGLDAATTSSLRTARTRFAAVAARASDRVYNDPVGDAEGPAPDIRAIDVADDAAGTISFRVAYANRTCVGRGEVVLAALDVDQNRFTGVPGLGAEYIIGIDGSSNEVLAAKWEGTTFVDAGITVRASCGAGDAFSVHKTAIGVTDKFTFWVVAAKTVGNDDYFDDAGPATYSMRTAAPAPPPVPGSVAPAAGTVTRWCGDPASAARDRPDAATGPQVHVVYAVPADAPDRFAARAHAIAKDVASIDAWWRGQTTRVPRFDLFADAACDSTYGRLDISLVRLRDAGAALASMSYGSLSSIVSGIVAQGMTGETKKYLVYYDGPTADDVPFCGLSEIGPNESGNSFAFVLVHDGRYPDGSTCGDVGTNDFNALAAAHELLHNFGAVAAGAPHLCEDSGHVCGDPTDLMSAGGGDEAYDDLGGALLDPGKDDYYGHGGAWWDVADSPFLAQTSTRKPSSTGASDRAVPTVRALPSSGKRGTRMSLRYVVRDNSGMTANSIDVYRGSAKVAALQTKLGEVGQKVQSWAVPAAATTPLRFCVRAKDAAGNSSKASCAAITLRRA